MSFSQNTNLQSPTETKIQFYEPNKSDITWELETDLENYDSLKIAPSQVFNIYVGLKQNENLKKEVKRLKKIAIDLNSTIQQQNAEHQKTLDQIKELNSQYDSKAKELSNKEIEIEKLKQKAKRFSIGPSAGYSFDGRIYGGIGVNYALFRF